MKTLKHAMVLLLALGSAACASSELEVPLSHPGHRDAPAGQVQRTAALSDGVGEATPSAVVYTCPMHPEITRPEPGNCPICGMKLVPRKEAK